MRTLGLVSVLIAMALVIWLVTVRVVSAPQPEVSTETDNLDPVIKQHIEDKSDLIVLDAPAPNAVIQSPLTIKGKARGPWFFEASFPVILTNWDGLIIAEHYASADGEWMTEDFVPFMANLEFENPYKEGDPDFMRRGTLILRKDNPSDLPEHDDYLEIPVYFDSF